MFGKDLKMNLKLMAAGTLFAVGAICVSVYGKTQAHAASYKTLAEEEALLEDIPGVMPVDESIEDYVKNLKMLTEKEKKQLIAAEKEKEPYYDKLNDLMDKINYKTNAIVKEADPIFDKIWELRDGNKKLWDKLDSGENAKQKAVGNDMVKYIQLSDKLTSKEKKVLVGDQKKIDLLYKKVDEYYAKAEEVNAPLNKELEEVRAKIQKIDDANAAIWEKIYGKNEW